MDAETRKRHRWVELYRKHKNYSVVSLKCGVSRPTLRKWVTRYEQSGLAGLTSQSRRPKTSPITRIGERERNWILALRRRRLGSPRIQSELDRAKGFQILRTTIDKILAESGTVPLLRTSRNRKATARYARQIPGERVQMDTCKIGPGRYQSTAVDDCTRIRVLALYSRGSGANTLLFLERLLEELPFPVQRIQTEPWARVLCTCCSAAPDGLRH